MSEDLREIIAAEMGDAGYECPMCLDYVYEQGDKCSCSKWTEEEVKEFMKVE